jgi:hypothetical protein
MGYVHSVREIRQIVGDSFELKKYYPSKELDWAATYQRYLDIIRRK